MMKLSKIKKKEPKFQQKAPHNRTEPPVIQCFFVSSKLCLSLLAMSGIQYNNRWFIGWADSQRLYRFFCFLPTEINPCDTTSTDKQDDNGTPNDFFGQLFHAISSILFDMSFYETILHIIHLLSALHLPFYHIYNSPVLFTKNKDRVHSGFLYTVYNNLIESIFTWKQLDSCLSFLLAAAIPATVTSLVQCQPIRRLPAVHSLLQPRQMELDWLYVL